MFSIYFCFFYQQVAAQAGQKVHLVDIDGEAISKAEKRIADSLQRVAKKKFKVLLYLRQFVWNHLSIAIIYLKIIALNN